MLKPATSSAYSAFVFVALWVSIAYTMVLCNKMILTVWGFNYPFFLILCHSIFCLMATQTLSVTHPYLLKAINEGYSISLTEYIQKIMPIAALFTVSVVCSNVVYSYLSLGYIQMLKAVHPVPTYLLGVLFGRVKLSLPMFSIVLHISVSIVLTAAGALEFNWLGVGIQAASTFADALRCVLIDSMLKGSAAIDSMSMLYLISPSTTFFVFLGFMWFEFDTFPLLAITPSFFGVLLASAALAFSLNLAVLALIGNTSSLLMSVSAPVKDILLIVTSYFVFESPITRRQLLGYGSALLGLWCYRRFEARPELLWYEVWQLLARAGVPLECRAAEVEQVEVEVLLGDGGIGGSAGGTCTGIGAAADGAGSRARRGSSASDPEDAILAVGGGGGAASRWKGV